MRYLRSLALAACLLPASLVAQSTEDEDRGYLQGLIEDALSGAGREVRIKGFAGALSSTATLEALTIADADGVWLTLTNAQLEWRRAALLRGRLEVDRLTAQALTLNRLPSAEPEEDTGFRLPELPPPQATAFSLPDLPVSIQIGEVGIDTVALGAAVLGQAVEVELSGSASLAEGEGDADLTIGRLDGPRGQFQIGGSYANETNILALVLSVSEDADGLIANLVDMPDRPSLDLSIAGEGPLSDFAADIGLRTDDVDRLAGRVTVGSTQTDAGATEQFFAADIAGDIRPLLQPDYRTFFGEALALDLKGGRGADGGLDIDTLAIQSAALNVNGQVALGPDGWPERFQLEGQIAPVDRSSVLLSIPGPETRLDRVDLSVRFNAALGDQWDLRILADNVTRDGFALGEVLLSGQGTIATGEGVAIGQADGALDMTIAGLDLGEADLTAAVGSDLSAALEFVLIEDQPFELNNIDLSGADYALTGDMSFTLPDGSQSPVVGTALTLAADNIARFAPVVGQPISGGVRVDVTGDLIPLDGAFDLRVAGVSQDLSVGIEQVDPLIAGRGDVSVTARRDAEGTFLEHFAIRTPQSQIEGQAAIQGDVNAASLTARIFDASLVHPDMSGDGQIDLRFDQSGTAINADLGLRAPGNTVADIVLQTPEGSEISEFRADIRSEDLSVYAWAAGRPIGGQINLSAEGQGNLQTQSCAARLSGTASDVVTGIAEADTLLAGAVEFVLDAIRADNGALTLNEVRVNAPRISADLSGDLSDTDSRLAYRLSIPNIGLLVPALPGAVTAEGTLASAGDDWQIASALTGPAGMQLSVDGTVDPVDLTADISASGAAPLALANRQIAPNIVEGLLRFDLGVRGPLDVASVSGTVTTSGATLSLPAQKLAFDSIDSTVGLSGGRANVDAQLSVSTGGSIGLSGPVTLSDPFSGNLSIAINQMVVVEPGLLETVANGQLSVNGPLTGGATVAGEISFDEVGIQVPSTLGAASAALPGLQHVNEPAPVRQSRAKAGLIETESSRSSNAPPYGLDVTISAPSQIFIRGRGLDAEMGGSLRITGTTDQVIPSGQFELLRGRLSILGQRVDLTEGFIEPQGDLDPYMRIVAEAKAGSTDVILVIEGEISAPELTMTSSPELPEDEILSRFLFGRDLTEISALQALQIADALAQLSGRGPGAIGGLRRGLGLDDLDVTTTETGDTSVRAGRYLSDNLYSDVSRTSDGETEINLNLSITPNLTARGTARTDSSTGIGIFMEKDY